MRFRRLAGRVCIFMRQLLLQMMHLNNKEKRLLFISLAIPILFSFLAFLSQILEYYFRFSDKYHFIYSWGSSFSFLVQMILILVSMTFGIYFLDQRKQLNFQFFIFGLLLSSSVFLYCFIALLIILSNVSSV
jgi:hypothetical protein